MAEWSPTSGGPRLRGSLAAPRRRLAVVGQFGLLRMSTGVWAPDTLSEGAGSTEQFTPGALWQSSFGTQPFHTGGVLLPAPGSLGFSVRRRVLALMAE